MAKTEQTHRPIGSVGSDRLDQSEESCEQAQDQSEASCEQVHQPIRSVGLTIASTNQKSFTKQRRSREGAAQPIRLRLAGRIGGRLVTPEGRTFCGLVLFLRIFHQVRTTDQPIRSLHWSFFGLISFLRILHQVRTTDHPIRSLHRSNSDGLIRMDFLRTNFVSSDSSPSEKHGSANQIETSE